MACMHPICSVSCCSAAGGMLGLLAAAGMCEGKSITLLLAFSYRPHPRTWELPHTYP